MYSSTIIELVQQTALSIMVIMSIMRIVSIPDRGVRG